MIKKNLFYFTVLIISFTVMSMMPGGDPEFKIEWESTFDNNAKVRTVSNPDGTMILGTSNTAATLLDGNGKTMWSNKFKDISTNKTSNADIQNVMWDAGVLFLFDKKVGKDRITVIDIKSGKELWNTDKYQGITEENMQYIPVMDAFAFSLKSSLVMIKARTGEELWETDKFKGSIGKALYLADKNELIMINFKPTKIAAFFTGFKNQFVRINAANGKVIWDATFKGKVEKKVVTREPIVDIIKKNDKIFLYLEGLQVFDYNSGQMLWEAVWGVDLGASKGQKVLGRVGGKKILAYGIYGAIAEPLITDDALYIVKRGSGKGSKFIQKHDLETGKIIWKTERIEAAKAIPKLHYVNGMIIAQVGGLVNEQKIVQSTDPKTKTVTTTYISQMIWLGKYGIAGIDDKSGKYVWRSEKFKKRITDLVFDDNSVFAASGIEFYSMDIKTGKENYITDHTAAKVGKSMWAFDIGDAVAVVCDKGMAAYNKSDGSMKYTSGKFKGVTNMYTAGDNFFLRNSKSKFTSVDLKTGNVKGIVKCKGKGGGGRFGNGVDVTEDGEYIFVFKGKNVSKLKVN